MQKGLGDWLKGICGCGCREGKTILLIDDEQGFVKMMKSGLISQGFNVLVARTGEQGLSVTRRKKPDLIVLDIILPKMKGREVCIKLKEDAKTKDIPVITLTSKSSTDDVKAEIELGAIGHLTKPLNLQMLLTEIKEILKI